MFKKILIANRGEIACRIIKTAKKMGIGTVAIYSDADENALHVQQADEAVHIGGSASSDSYLKIERILKSVRQVGADAVHPGYGFLSENPAFAEALEKEGVTFIGPKIEAIASMGDKIESKKIAASAGVNTVPGHVGIIADDMEAIQVANEIGFPVMIKASAGGGGKGMRVAYNDEEVRDGFRSAVNEAVSSFGDDRVFIEKYIEQPRHIEIQIIADSAGNTVFLGERECSIQRRHQKVIEEAPSPVLDEITRRKMGEQAVSLARAVNYVSAGTVEFIVDKDRNFYFLEMNTRLQVEHPVTECITGIDLVELMIRISAGDLLPVNQEDVRLKGWAIEARVYAEDPYRGFLPSTGRLIRYQPPPESAGIRIDTGVKEGSEISMYYDPMIAKVVAFGHDRDQAIKIMIDALNYFRIRGVSNNLDFLAAVMMHKKFQKGKISTAFIAEEFPSGFKGACLGDEIILLLKALVAAYETVSVERNSQISGQVALARRYNSQTNDSAFVVLENDVITEASVFVVNGGYDVTVDGRLIKIRGRCDSIDLLFKGTIDDIYRVVQVEREGLDYKVNYSGAERVFKIFEKRFSEFFRLMPLKQAPDLGNFLLSPMPGLLVSFAVKEGDQVKAGQELAIVEAMKMENIMRAEKDGVVSKLHASAGDNLAVDQPIIEFK